MPHNRIARWSNDMSHAFTVTDEQYAALAQRALACGMAPEDLFTW